MTYNGLDEFFKKTKIPDIKSGFSGPHETEEEIKSKQELLLMCKKIQESLLKGLSNDLVKENVRRMVIPNKTIRENVELLTELVHDPLLKCKIITYPEYYGKDGCRQNRKYLDKIHLKVPFVRAISSCEGCMNNVYRYCRIIGGKILGSEEMVPSKTIVQKINERLYRSPTLAKECVDLENYGYLQGLNAAITTSKKKPDMEYTHQKHATDNSNLILSLNKCVNEKEGKIWTKIQLNNGLTVSSLQKILAVKFGSEANKIIRECIASMDLISANVLDNCKNQSFDFHKDAKLIKVSKCRECVDSKEIWCGRTALQFSSPSGVLEDNNLTPEAKEVLSFFKDSNAEIIIDAEPVRKNFEIEFQNAGAHIILEGIKSTGGDIDLQDFTLNSSLGDIEVNPDQNDPPIIDIEGFDGGMGDLPDGVI